MEKLIIYYLVGVAVSMFNIWFYRYSKYKQQPKKSDALASLFGVWLWPLQMLLFFNQIISK